MSVQSILVKGPAVRVALVGAYLARRWLTPQCRLVLLPDEPNADARTMTVRPDHLRFHAELGLALETLIKEAKACLLFAPKYESASGVMKLPFLPVGGSVQGVEFQHYWLRANERQSQPDLLTFSQAIALQEADQGHAFGRVQKGASGFGLTVQSQSYARLLLGLASHLGAQVLSPEKAASVADLVFDCLGDATPAWSGSQVTLFGAPPLPGLEWQVSVNAARRFVSLSSSSSTSGAEQREYTRLSAGEAQRIADMQELLEADDPTTCDSATLRRKVELFAACGRIPNEDFEVFTQAEWLAALWQKGLRPRRYDRMADLMPEAQLMSMLAQYKDQTAAITRMKENA